MVPILPGDTNGGTSLTRPGTVPDRSDTVLVTSMTYNATGESNSQTNPGGIKTCLEYDAAGRQVKQILNCIDGSSSSSSSSSSSGPPASDDTNVTVETAYNADGNVKSITAVNSVTGNQVTTYVFGTTLSDSDIASSLLKRAEIYPDSDDVTDPLGNGADGIYDRIEFKYNEFGQMTKDYQAHGGVVNTGTTSNVQYWLCRRLGQHDPAHNDDLSQWARPDVRLRGGERQGRCVEPGRQSHRRRRELDTLGRLLIPGPIVVCRGGLHRA
ncbi:MAG: hypothetical protein ACC645_08805 [Pirellulales bacterium]